MLKKYINKKVGLTAFFLLMLALNVTGGYAISGGWDLSGFDDLTFVILAIVGMITFVAIALSVVAVIVLILPAGKGLYSAFTNRR